MADNGTTVTLTDISDSVEVGALTASSLVVNGITTLDGNVSVGNGFSILPDTDLGSDIGSSSYRFNNLWVANINSNSSQSFSGQTTFSYAPTDTTIAQASVLINPTTSVANGQLLGFGIAGYQRALIDAEGDLILGYNNLTSAPVTNYPLTIYGHNGTNTLYVDTSGNVVTSGNLDINGTTSDIAGALNLSGNSLTSSGALTITPAAGNNLNIALSTTGDFAVNTNDLVVDTSLGYIGINTTAPTALLDLAGTSGIDAFRLTNSGTKVLGLSYATNNVTFDQTSTDPTNKLSNGSLDSDLTSWSEVPSYTLNDQFTTDRAAGAVNGTSAEPTGGTRTVGSNVTNQISISNGSLVFSGQPSASDGFRESAVTRSAGLTLIMKLDKQSSWGYGRVGFGDSDTTNSSFAEGFLLDPNVGNQQYNAYLKNSGTSEKLAIVLRSSGAYYFDVTNGSLLWITGTNNTATLYPRKWMSQYSNESSSLDYFRVPTSTWLPTPLAYDTFTRGDGAIGSSETTGPDSQTTPSLAWTGGAISSNKNVITPSLGSEALTNGDMETGDPPTGWTGTSGTTLSSNADAHGGSAALNVVSTGTPGTSKAASTTIGTWYTLSSWNKIVSGNNITITAMMINSPWTQYIISNGISSTSYVNTNLTFRSASTSDGVRFNSYTGTYLADDVSIKPLTLSSLFSSVSTSDADVIADANVTLTAGTQAGLVLNLDSTSSPANFIIVYHDGTSVKVDEAVAGVYTNKQTTTVTYSAGATLRAIREGTKLRVYYNNALVGAELTMTANTNTKHGLFSTYSGNSFDNFTLWPRGSGTTKFTSAPFEELVATRNTTTKYNNSTASVQLVAGGTDANYVQSVNVGDTQTYNLIAYAYTDGSAVSATDLSLYYDGSVLSTKYSVLGGTGWYKLTGSFTGVASAKDYGVRVKAGKTVYVDEMHLQVGTGTNQTMYVLNSGTGVTGLNVQGIINGTGNGVATLTKAGTISDTDFTDTAVDGLFAFDTTNHRLYFREGGAWSYIAKTGGFQVPAEEASQLTVGDLLIPYVESRMSDGAIHGMYKKLDDTSLPSLSVIGDTTLGDAIISGSLLVSNIDSTTTLNLQQLALSGISFVGGNIKFTKEGLIYGNDLIRGKEVMPIGETSLQVTKPWLEAPVSVTLTPEYNTTVWVENISKDGFVIHTSQTEATESGVFWEALW